MRIVAVAVSTGILRIDLVSAGTWRIVAVSTDILMVD
jgi:hypothetical protein